MKTSQMAKNILLVSALLLVAACSESRILGTVKPDLSEMTTQSARTQDITLKKGKLIEVVYPRVRKGKEQSLKNDYFPKAMPIVREYGGKMLGRFKVIKKAGGEISPQMIGIFEWPDLAAKESLMQDVRYQKIIPIRDAAFSFLKFGYYNVGKDTTIQFKENKVYEFFGAWLDPSPTSKDKLNEYFKVSGPIKKRYGRPEPIFKTMLGTFKDAPKGAEVYSPQMAGIVEWDKSEDFFILQENKDFKKDARPLFDASIARIDWLHTKIMIKSPVEMAEHQEIEVPPISAR